MFKRAWWLAAGGVILVATLAAFQMPWRVYTSMEPYDDIPLSAGLPGSNRLGLRPADVSSKSRIARAAVVDSGAATAIGVRAEPVGLRIIRAPIGTSLTALRRLTRLDVRSVEQPVNLDDEDDVYNWPWLAAGEMGDWLLTPSQAAKLRDYLLRGGFLYLDDFWGPQEWAASKSA